MTSSLQFLTIFKFRS